MGREISLRARPVTPADCAWLAQWECDRPYPWSEKMFRETIGYPINSAMVFETQESPVGFCVLQLASTQAHLLNVMVRADVRHQGIGQTIMAWVETSAKERGAADLVLDVDATNAPARRLYEKRGFVVLERRPGAYPRGEDAIIMRKYL